MSQPATSLRLQGKVCIVTGSSSGLGRAISLAYAREGAVLVCADLQPQARVEVTTEGVVSTHELIKQNGGKAAFVKTDVTKTEEVEGMVKFAVAEFGRVDVLVNNAGISYEAGREQLRIHDTPEHWYDVTMAVNTKSVFMATKYAIAQMLQQEKSTTGDRGYIINLSSIFGLVGGKNIPTYAASKGAVSNLTKQVALDYAADGIHCNAICPGYTETAIFVNTAKTQDADAIRAKHPLHGTGMPEDIAGAAVFLASGEARWITGALLPVDGGFTAQ